MAAPQFQADEARKLFSIIAPSQIHLVYIHPNGLKVQGRDFGHDIDAAIHGAHVANESGFNVYWTVNAVRPGLHTKPHKSDIMAARFAHVDIDPPKTGGAFDKPAIVEAIMAIPAPPSFVVDSGGGLQAFWQLDEPCENLLHVERINQQLRDYFDADACWNIDRLMRVPGTVNWPDKRKAARGRVASLAKFCIDDDGVVYVPSSLSASFPEPTQNEGGHETPHIAIPETVKLISANDLGLSATSSLRISIDMPPGTDRSGDGVACAGDLARAGYDDETIIGVLVNPANAVSAHYLNQRNPLRAAARAVEQVRRDIPATITGPDPEHAYFNTDELIANIMARSARQNGGTVPVDDGEDEEPRPRWHVPAGLPAWRRDLGDGGLGMFVDHVTKTAPSPQPYVTLGAAIAAFGALSGRRYASPTNLRTNVYCIGIADSGGGKDHPLRSASSLLVDAGYHNYVGGGKIASGQAMITDVTNSPTILYPLDEIGFLISGAADRKRSQKHILDIMDNLTEFYSMSDQTFLGTSYANQDDKAGGKPRKVIEQPNLCLVGVTTPGVFWGSLKSDNIMDGSLARMLIFESENNYPDPQFDLGGKGWPAMLINRAKAVAGGAEGHNAFPLGEGASIAPKPYTVEYADVRAASMARDMRIYQTQMLREHQGTNFNAIIARMAENALKLALIKAISDGPGKPVITCADLEWGQLVSRTSVDTLMKAVKERVADNDNEARIKRLHRIIADAGSAGIDHTALYRKSQFMGGRRALMEAIDFMIESGTIRVQNFPRADGKAGGRGLRVYFDTA